MADFTTKLSVLAGAAMLLAGSAFGQATYTATPVSVVAGFIRAEGTTEKLPTTTVNLTGAVIGSVTLTVYVSPALSITSKTSGTPAVSETLAVPNGCVPGPCAGVAGTVNGSIVTFSNIPTTATTNAITIDNIRVNASALAVATGVPTAVSEQIFLTGANATPALASPVPVAYALNGLTAATVPTTGTGVPASNTICATVDASVLQFRINVTEAFAKAFKTRTEEGGGIAANSATRFAVTFNNVPANVLVRTPITVNTNTASGAGVLTMITSPTTNGAGTAVTAVTGTTGTLVPIGNVAIANGTGTAYYEVTTATSAGLLENFPVDVYFASTQGAVTAQAAAVTATVSFAPIGAAANTVPNFVNGSSTTTVTGSTYGACATYLLFPYLTNAAGFESGIAITNASRDNFGTAGASSVATQNGSCVLSFYGNATVANNPANSTTSSISSGTTSAFTLTSVSGANFTGYMIANCNFQYAHGFTYIVSQFGTSSGVAMGYVASPFNGTGATPRVLGVGGVEVLGN